MGTTAEKLKYLNETKAEIKNALETPYNVMRDYPELIKKYIDNQPTKVVNDGICSNAVDLPVKAVEIEGNSYQETTEGYQLLDTSSYSTETKNGVTATRRRDGSIKVTGTATADVQFDIASFTPNSKDKVYFLSGCPAGGSISTYYLNLNVYGVNDVGEGVSFTNKTNLTYVRIKVASGVTIDKVFYLMITEGVERKPYEPYTGGIPSPNLDYLQKITNVGERGYNLLNVPAEYTVLSIENNKEVPISLKANTKYTIKIGQINTDNTEVTKVLFRFRYNKADISNPYVYVNLSDLKAVYTLASDVDAVWIYSGSGYNESVKTNTTYKNLMIYEGTEDKPYEPYTDGIKIKQSGKNLFDNSKASPLVLLSYSNGIYSASDNDTNTTLGYKIQQYDSNRKYIPLAGEVRQNIDKPGIYYFTAQKYITAKYLRIGNLGKKQEFQLYYPLDDINVGDYYTVVINIIDTTIGASKFKDVMLLKGKITSASYEPYHEPIITPINLQGNILSKVGDVKDILRVNRNGEVEIKKNIEKIVLNGREKLVQKSSSTTRTYWGIDFSNYGIYQYNDPTKVCDVLTTKFKSRPQQGAFLPGQVALATNNKNMYFVFEPDTTEEQARAILKDMPVYFRLAEPQTIKLLSISPIELWQGTNIFKLITNLDTDFEVEYVVDKDSVTKGEE